MAGCARPHIVDGALRLLSEGTWAPSGFDFRFLRALPIRAVRRHLEVVISGAAVDEAHPAGVEGRRRAERYSVNGHGKSSGCRTHGPDEHDFCGPMAGR